GWTSFAYSVNKILPFEMAEDESAVEIWKWCFITAAESSKQLKSSAGLFPEGANESLKVRSNPSVVSFSFRLRAHWDTQVPRKVGNLLVQPRTRNRMKEAKIRVKICRGEELASRALGFTTCTLRKEKETTEGFDRTFRLSLAPSGNRPAFLKHAGKPEGRNEEIEEEVDV
nr:hypothetical protein [Tanacetum cinerariifolium]